MAKQPSIKRYYTVDHQVGEVKVGYRNDYGDDAYSVTKTKGSSSYSSLRMTRREAEDMIEAMRELLIVIDGEEN